MSQFQQERYNATNSFEIKQDATSTTTTTHEFNGVKVSFSVKTVVTKGIGELKSIKKAMKILTLYCLIFVSVISCKAQEKMTLKYIRQNYNLTKNKSFINNELAFLKLNDTLRINVKLPYDSVQHQIIDRGIYYDCHLKSGTIYTIKLRKVCVNDIPDEFNSYYKINTIANKKECSKFREVEKNTDYLYKGNYGKFVDINNVLYEIIELSPDDDCLFQH